MPPDASTMGAYGFRFAGVDPERAGLAAGQPDWPLVSVGRHAALAPDDARGVTHELLGDCTVRLGRDPLQADFACARELRDEELGHPLLSFVSATLARWIGREAVHAGAVLAHGGAWAVVADRGGGKSTTLAALARSGWPVLSDDLLVIEDGAAFRGPRSVDLRASGAQMVGGPTRPVRGTRHRLALGPAAARAPLAGLIFLEWGGAAGTRPASPAERMRRLAEQRVGSAQADRAPELALGLAALPGHVVTRPRGLPGLEATLAAIAGVAGEPSA
jgi:hypothetical protein